MSRTLRRGFSALLLFVFIVSGGAVASARCCGDGAAEDASGHVHAAPRGALHPEEAPDRDDHRCTCLAGCCAADTAGLDVVVTGRIFGPVAMRRLRVPGPVVLLRSSPRYLIPFPLAPPRIASFDS